MAIQPITCYVCGYETKSKNEFLDHVREEPDHNAVDG